MPATAAAATLDELVLALHPTSKGFGWVVFESPLVPIDWGIATAKVRRGTKVLRRLERIANRYEPDVMVLEEFDGGDSRRGPRIQKIARSIVSLGERRGLYVPIYGRDAVRECFAPFGATSRHEIAEVIASHIKALAMRLPKKRKPWESENPRQSIFDAAALALTYYTSRGELFYAAGSEQGSLDR